MSVNDKHPYVILPQLLLRAPHYSFGGYDLSRLPEVLQQEDFRDALWLASPEFYHVIADKDFDFKRLSSKEIHTLSKYYNRICFRPTPFGTFASFTLLEWADGQPVRIGKADLAKIHLLPDQQTLSAIHAAEPLNDCTLLIVNSSLYRAGKYYRYSRTMATGNSRYTFSLDGIAAVSFHTKLLESFKRKNVTVLEVLEWIAENGACSMSEARNYLDFLIAEQVLLTPASGSIIYTGRPTVERFSVPGWKAFWEKYRTLTVKDAVSLSDISSKLGTLLEGVLKAYRGQPLYAALEKPHLGGGPSPVDKEKLINVVDVMARLSLSGTSVHLTNFITAFRERFDQEKVPLLLALDEDMGIPYGDFYSPVMQPKALENIQFQDLAVPAVHTDWTAVHRLLFRLWTGDALRDPLAPLVITDDCLQELNDIGLVNTHLPQTLAVMYRKAGEYLIIEGAAGVAATALIGRFSCFSQPLHDLCLELSGEEIRANPDVVFADIGQLSDSHVDNINRRQQIYPYEIPINVYSELPKSEQLPPSDLLITVRGKELILESIKLGKRVIPRLSTAYNFRHNELPLFRLLCDLQYQGIKSGLTFDPEQLFPGLKFYPRIMYDRTILNLAKWHFKSADIKAMVQFTATDPIEALDRFRTRYRIPRHISLGASDQQLVFDLAHTDDAAFFVQCLKGQAAVTIQEYLVPGREVLSGHKPVAGQFIAFLKHGQQIYQGTSFAGKRMAVKQQRSFTLGSEWLYLKLFCTPRIADELLVRIIQPFVQQYRELIPTWFFIRYTEKGNHLRLRLNADPSKIGILLVALQKKMAAAGYEKMIRNYQGETYQRELERYGKAYETLLEKCFCAGSEWVISELKKRKDQEWGEMKLALLTADRMIQCFLSDEESCLAFLKQVSERFIKEFRGEKPFLVAMDSKYRELKTMLPVLNEKDRVTVRLNSLLKSVKELSLCFLHEPLDSRFALLADLIHMQLNRTFAIRQREQECLVYYILEKNLVSQIARRQRSF